MSHRLQERRPIARSPGRRPAPFRWPQTKAPSSFPSDWACAPGASSIRSAAPVLRFMIGLKLRRAQPCFAIECFLGRIGPLPALSPMREDLIMQQYVPKPALGGR